MTPTIAPVALQFAVTLGLLALFSLLTRRYRKAYLGWWTAVWLVFVVRLVAITQFVATDTVAWLWLHQAATGWTAAALLGAAWSFSRRTITARGRLTLALAPPVWATLALAARDQFFVVVGVAVVLLSAATAIAGWSFLRHHRDTRSPSAFAIAITLFAWALHHLDYPLLRHWDAWNPWGYHLDTLFEVALGVGVLFLVLEDVERGARALAALAFDVDGDTPDAVRATLLERSRDLPGVDGSALVDVDDRTVAAVGTLSPRSDPVLASAIARASDASRTSGRSIVARHAEGYVAALPLRSPERPAEAGTADLLVVAGRAREPFAALDEAFLTALGRQAGLQLEKRSLVAALSTRSGELATLSAAMMRQHEDDRRQLARELHDETAQVFSAVRLQLGLLAEASPERVRDLLPRSLALIDEGLDSIRSVTDRLRPPLLDDLGLDAALRALARDFERQSGLVVECDFGSGDSPFVLDPDAEWAVFRAVQEGLSNVSRHADATRVSVDARWTDDETIVRVTDDGRGPREAAPGRMGLIGMRERLQSIGGSATLRARTGGPGSELEIRAPRGETGASPEAAS